MERGVSTLWRNAEFLKLWIGQAVSQIGSQVSFLALPLVAVLALNATAFEMGLLTAASAIPSLLIGFFAGVFVDRHHRRPVLITTDLGRTLLLSLVPLAWIFGVLSMPLLTGIAFLGGILTVFFDVAYQALIPSLVEYRHLMEANSKLELARTAAATIGPALAGWLVRVLTGPIAVCVDALSDVISAGLISTIRQHETSPSVAEPGQHLWYQIREGLGAVLHDERLRAIVGSRVLIGLFNAMLEAVIILYFVRSLGLGPALIGLVFSIGSLGFLLGAVLSGRIAARYGVGLATIGGLCLSGGGDLLVPFARGPQWMVLGCLIVAEFAFGLGLTVFNVNQASLRQALIPSRLQGRASATVRVFASGMIPLGAVLGGLLGEMVGLRTTLVVAALGELLAAGWVWTSPLRRLRVLPNSLDEPVVQSEEAKNSSPYCCILRGANL